MKNKTRDRWRWRKYLVFNHEDHKEREERYLNQKKLRVLSGLIFVFYFEMEMDILLKIIAVPYYSLIIP